MANQGTHGHTKHWETQCARRFKLPQFAGAARVQCLPHGGRGLGARADFTRRLAHLSEESIEIPKDPPILSQIAQMHSAPFQCLVGS